MILQKIQFPQIGICDRELMYFVTDGMSIIESNAQEVRLEKGSVLSTNTYFNSFSIGKWNKYTKINDVSINLCFKGDFLITLYSISITNDRLNERKLLEVSKKHSSKKYYSLKYTDYENQGILCFKMQALSDDCVFYGGAYETSDSFVKNDVKIAVGICTFKREADVYHNIELLNNYIINNKDSVLYNKLDIYISDNSQTLDDKKLNSKHVHVYKNKNLGGSGGFTRALIEIKNNKDKKYSHVLLMDDDITINPESLVYTYTFLQCLKPEYSEAFIGGHMINKDRQFLQSEAADHFDLVKHHPVKYQYNLENPIWIVKNEIEDTINYFGWWYCCMPVDVITDKNLPIPVFIKRDDIEYGLRNGKTFITLNGICVWHEAFEFKGSAHLDYYYLRNLCIMNSKHRKGFKKKQLISEMTKLVLKNNLMRYRYRNAELLLMGVQDYLKGIDWFKDLEGEGFNQALMKLNYTKKPINDINYVFQYGNYTKNMTFKESKLKKIIRKLTLNGWFLKKKKNIIVPSYEPDIGLFYRANRVINYEDSTKSAFITQKSYKNFFIIIGMYLKTVISVLFKFDKVKKEYNDRFSEITNINFWNDYLNREKKNYDIKSKLVDETLPRNNKRQYLTWFSSLFLIGLQWVLFFIPVKKNRIMLSVHDRKGFTCNPKYVLKEIKEEYGDKYEVIWISKYPKSCFKDNKYNIEVVKVDSLKHFLKYLRTRVYVTNDRFPTWAAHKFNQKWINLWHGAINYKHIGYDYLAPRSSVSWKIFRLANRQPDYYVSASRFFSEDTAKSFYYDRNIFVEYGFPRNDLMFSKDKELKNTIKDNLKLPKDKKIALFAPTFRIGMKSSYYGLDFTMLKKSLEKRFGKDWIILFRNHNFVSRKNINIEGIVDVTDYNDMNELLYISDVLISDYSSCMYDFSLQKKPCFVYATDIDTYTKNDRSFALSISEWPYPIAKSNEELANNIIKFNEKEYNKKIDEHFKETGSFDDGEASKRVVKLINKLAKNYKKA